MKSDNQSAATVVSSDPTLEEAPYEDLHSSE